MSSSRLGISTNLATGDKYDLLLVSTPDYPVGQLKFKFENTPRKIAGIQKVAQTFLRILFTTKGSDLIYVNLGTSFPNLALRSNRSDQDSVFLAEIASAVQDAESQTKMVLNSVGIDPSAQLARVSVLGSTSDKESLSLYLQMVTMAGEQARIAVPFPQLDLKTING